MAKDLSEAVVRNEIRQKYLKLVLNNKVICRGDVEEFVGTYSKQLKGGLN